MLGGEILSFVLKKMQFKLLLDVYCTIFFAKVHDRRGKEYPSTFWGWSHTPESTKEIYSTLVLSILIDTF